jgi:hypothetical protein
VHDVRATESEAFDLIVATTPPISGATVLLTTLFGTGGTDAGLDEDGAALAFPVTMTEVGATGSYLARVQVAESGPYWAKFTVNGVAIQPTLVRVVSSGASAEDAVEGTPYTLAVVAPSKPASMQVVMRDRSGASIGSDDAGEAYVWPQAMTAVPGHTDAWYFESVTFSDGGRVHVAVTPAAGPVQNLVVSVAAVSTAGTLGHFSGWEPDAGIVPDDWVTLSYIRRWTGWTSAHISDEDLREIRRTAIETFIKETNVWVPGWSGTFHGLRGQGSRLFLPVPIVLPAQGGSEPVVKYTEDFGDQEEVSTIDNDELTWRVGGMHSRQPYLEMIGAWWDPSLEVAITATWGLVDARRASSTAFKQCLVGLCRWHALSFGKDADEARDQSTLFRISSEGSRDMRVDYDQSAIGDGLTGDRTIDRAIASFRVEPGPWSYRDGDSGLESEGSE